MSAFGIVVMQPVIQIGLQRVNAFVELLAERDLVKLLQDRLVETFTNAVCLWRFYLGFGMVDIVDRQEELEVMFVDAPAVLRAPVGHDPQHRQVVCCTQPVRYSIPRTVQQVTRQIHMG